MPATNKNFHYYNVDKILEDGLTKWQASVDKQNACLCFDVSKKHKKLSNKINAIVNYLVQESRDLELDKEVDNGDSLLLLLDVVLEYGVYNKFIIQEIESKLSIRDYQSFKKAMKRHLQEQCPEKKIIDFFETAKKNLKNFLENSNKSTLDIATVLSGFKFNDLVNEDSQVGKFLRGDYQDAIALSNLKEMGMGL